MKLRTLIFIMTCLSLFSCTSREDEIKSVVNRWNEIHNNHNANEFKELYTPDVMFYGLKTSMETCYVRKKTFLTPEFHQEIISPISISYYSSGIIKCDFTKRTNYRKEKVREYYCYLLLKKEGGKYLVSGESDLISDQKRNPQLELGTKIARPAGNTAIYIIILLVLATAGVIFFVKKKNKKQASEWELFKEQYKAPEETGTIKIEPIVDLPDENNLVNKVKAAVMEEMKTLFPQDSPQQKGYLFEKFIVEKFDQNYFRLIEWRSDKFHDGKFAATSRLPDLEYHFITSRHDCKIAIECKWRADFTNNKKIEIARIDQLEKYWQYSIDNKIEVFIILGVGGKPEDPENLYIIPLENISGPVVYKDRLSNYKRYNQKGDFFYNAYTKILE